MKYLTPKEDRSSFFSLYRKRGFIESISVLMEQPNHELIQKDFLSILISKKSYPNLFFRTKPELLEHKIIAYKLDKNNEKVIYLTEKGIKLMNLINQIEKLVANPKLE